MTDETKKLFNAPWYVFSSPDDEITVIENEIGRVLAELDEVKTANRISRLPELYDELKRMVEVECINACEEHGPCDRPCDVVRPAIDLLKKVRDGE